MIESTRRVQSPPVSNIGSWEGRNPGLDVHGDPELEGDSPSPALAPLEREWTEGAAPGEPRRRADPRASGP